MIRANILESSEDRKVVEKAGIFSVIEYQRDMSVKPEMAAEAYFSSLMEVKKRQLVALMTKDKGVIAQKGRMQLMLGDIKATTDIKGAGDLVKKFLGSTVTGETAIKPLYTGEGTLVLEPSFRYIILEDLKDWTSGMIVEDGMFLACENTVNISVSSRGNVSSAVFGGEGLFNSLFTGEGVVALESPVPKQELIVLDVADDVVKIDGNMAIAWSKGFDFTVERTTPTLVGSVAAGEGLVNVYRGTGKILMAPVRCNRDIPSPTNKK